MAPNSNPQNVFLLKTKKGARIHHKYRIGSEEEYVAHNHGVSGSKPLSDIKLYFLAAIAKKRFLFKNPIFNKGK